MRKLLSKASKIVSVVVAASLLLCGSLQAQTKGTVKGADKPSTSSTKTVHKKHKKKAKHKKTVHHEYKPGVQNEKELNATKEKKTQEKNKKK